MELNNNNNNNNVEKIFVIVEKNSNSTNGSITYRHDGQMKRREIEKEE